MICILATLMLLSVNLPILLQRGISDELFIWVVCIAQEMILLIKSNFIISVQEYLSHVSFSLRFTILAGRKKLRETVFFEVRIDSFITKHVPIFTRNFSVI